MKEQLSFRVNSKIVDKVKEIASENKLSISSVTGIIFEKNFKGEKNLKRLFEKAKRKGD